MNIETKRDQFRQTLNDIRITDTIAIHTRNSVYHFMVIDPVKFYGLLVGGVVGPILVDAMILDLSKLKAGSRARILLGTHRRRIRTSLVRSVVHLRRD